MMVIVGWHPQRIPDASAGILELLHTESDAWCSNTACQWLLHYLVEPQQHEYVQLIPQITRTRPAQGTGGAAAHAADQAGGVRGARPAAQARVAAAVLGVPGVHKLVKKMCEEVVHASSRFMNLAPRH